MSFKIISSGVFSTLQDQGRYGYNCLGITHSGAMDEYAYLWSQKLLKSYGPMLKKWIYPYEENALEVMVGLKLEALSSMSIAITGADLGFKINNILKDIWQTHNIVVGDILSFDKRISGQRAYLAVKGGFESQKIYGSYTTTLKEGIGTKIERNTTLSVKPSPTLLSTRRVQHQLIPLYPKHLTLRLFLSYQNNDFTKEEQDKFFNTAYKISLQSDRMGYRLKGKKINPSQKGIISEAIALGSVQIPKDGQPIILLKERQTIGGYPKFGTIIPIDCFRLAQLGVGDSVNFEAIKIEETTTLLKDFYTLFKK